MSILLAADIGRRRTGLAIADTVAGFVVALETLQHRNEEELIKGVMNIVSAKKVTEFFIGLPLLPQGDDGEQSLYVRSIASVLEKQSGLPVTLLDERYTTAKGGESDPDARAACDLASVALQIRENRS